jgi:hypothetical protein
MGAALPAHGAAYSGLRSQMVQGGGECACIAGGKYESGFRLVHQFHGAAAVAYDDRKSHRHGFENRAAKRFLIGA